MATMSPGEIGELVRSVRKTLGLTQAELAELAGVGRRFVIELEAGHGRAELRKVADVMRTVGLEVSDEPDPIEMVRTPSGLVSFRTVMSRIGRPLSVPNRLWRLDPERATATVTLPHSVHWSGGGNTFDLADWNDRALAYRTLMLEATPSVLVDYVDGRQLVDMWDDMFVPPEIRQAWQSAVSDFRETA
ncbi:MAG: helix-turn-helix transcriptional regulator [Actinomycetota bacterium]|nr:helix-turn-helix transcriptional regulator [Actinomycetota bacterium]